MVTSCVQPEYWDQAAWLQTQAGFDAALSAEIQRAAANPDTAEPLSWLQTQATYNAALDLHNHEAAQHFAERKAYRQCLEAADAAQNWLGWSDGAWTALTILAVAAAIAVLLLLFFMWCDS